MAERIALFPGSFDPPTLGHLDLIQRASKIFDHVIVGIALNDAKKALFTVDERKEMLAHLIRELKNVSIASFEGLTVNFARERGAIAIIRGLRVISDFEYELSLAINNQKMNPHVDTVVLMPSEPYLYLSSRLVKEIARLGGSVRHYLSPEVDERLREKLEKTRI